MHAMSRRHDDGGAVMVLYAIVFALAIVPLLALGTTTYVRTTTDGELQRGADSGALAAAAAIPLGDLPFVVNYLDATSGGATTKTLTDLGLSYPEPDPLRVACDQAVRSASDPNNVGHYYAVVRNGPPTCDASYRTDPTLLGAAQACVAALGVQPPPLPGGPDFSMLLPALLRPGVQVSLSWRVNGPMDSVIGRGTPSTQTAEATARRRFKDMVVVPVATLPTGQTFNLDPVVADTRATVGAAIDGTEQLLRTVPGLGPCAAVLDAARDDVLDAVDPPSSGPQVDAVLSAAASTQSPVVVLRIAQVLGIPYLDFVPVCVEDTGFADASGSDYVAHLGSFGECSTVAPGGFRASLRRA